MKITIDIPKEFEKHFDNDRFKDSLERVMTDVNCQIKKELSISGNYEIETLEMLINAFKTAEPVKCGRWERRMSNIYACSECTNEVTAQQRKNYSLCPYCGAETKEGDL